MEGGRASGRTVVKMVRIVFAVTGILVAVVAASSPATAGAYNLHEEHWLSYYSPWCLRSTAEGADCGYATLGQCQVARSGVGGSCDPNPWYSELPSNGHYKRRHKIKRVAR
jgi:hypothetical protein